MSFVDTSSALIGDLAAPYALISGYSRFIGTIIPDVTVAELHTDEDTITVHPVETGSPISDHVFANPQIIEIRCGFSNSTAGFEGYVQLVYDEFLALKATREPFDVSTGKRYYTNMLFGNITVTTDQEYEFALMVTARLQQVIISDTTNAGATQANPSQTSPTSNTGNQTLQSAPSAPSYAVYNQGFGGIGHA